MFSITDKTWRRISRTLDQVQNQHKIQYNNIDIYTIKDIIREVESKLFSSFGLGLTPEILKDHEIKIKYICSSPYDLKEYLSCDYSQSIIITLVYKKNKWYFDKALIDTAKFYCQQKFIYEFQDKTKELIKEILFNKFLS